MKTKTIADVTILTAEDDFETRYFNYLFGTPHTDGEGKNLWYVPTDKLKEMEALSEGA